jgi:ACS family hexuronate transporter-like MFS transporter
MMRRVVPDSAQERDVTAVGTGWAVAAAATLGMSVSYIDRQTLAAVSPALRSELGIDVAQFGSLLSIFSVAYLIGAPAAGVLVDRLGARRGFAIAVVAWSIVAASHALATSFVSLLVLRALLGTSEAPSFPAAAQAIRRSLPGARRAAAYGLLFTGSSVGAMIAAPLAISLEARFGFRFAFMGTALVGTAWLPLWLYATRGGRLPHGDEPLEAGGPASIYRGPGPFTAPRPRWIDVMTSAPVLRALVAVVGSAPVLLFVLNFTPLYLVDTWQLPRTEIGGYLVFPPLFFDVGAIAFGWVASRRPLRTHADLTLVSLGLAASLALTPLAPTPATAMVIFSAAAAGGGGIYVLATADMLGRVPVSRTSAAGGMTASAQSLAHIVVSPLVGAAIARSHSFSGALVAIGVAVVPTTLAFVLWPSLRAR